jgi:mannose/cellobiose epimerase-like protein (N-acyl-D-glucosamine 2-epimerase family)
VKPSADSNALAAATSALGPDGTLAGYTLSELRDLYRYDLFEDYLPFHDRFVVDHELGGFTVSVDRDGTPVSTDKGTWYLGRGTWAMSYLYHHLDPSPAHLEAARQAVEFTLARRPSGDAFFPFTFSRRGEAVAPPEAWFYGTLFVANGLAEYSRAGGDPRYWDIARDLVLACVRRYDRDDYPPDHLTPDGPEISAPRVQGHWMCLINTVGSMLEMRDDAELLGIVDRSLDAVLNYHYNPDFGLNNEDLNHDLSRPDNDFAQFVRTGHSIETLWMILHEALRRRDRGLWDLAAARFRRHLEVAWDPVFGGAFHTLQHVERNEWVLGKVQWLQSEILIGTLCLVEHTGDPWAREWFSRTYRYVRDRFVLRQYGFRLWIDYADRRVTFERHASRAENYHHPRHLMLNLLALERMIQRGGRVSGVWDAAQRTAAP